MKRNGIVKIALWLALFSCSGAFAQELMIASGAGYKKPVSEVMTLFEEQTGIDINAVFGNIQMITGQAQMTGDISCIIGDKKFLKKVDDKLEKLTFSSYQTIGNGYLVLAYRQGITISKVEEIAEDKVKTIFMPQDKKAIYGVAGTEALASYGFTDKLASKVTQVATVPQVVSYLVTGNADVGFINLTEALANKEKLGGYILVPQDKYKEIIIVSGVVAGFEQDANVKSFFDFLKNESAKKVFQKYGVK